MTADLRKLAENTSETVRDLVSQVLIKHEMAALEIMHEVATEKNTLKARIDLALSRYDMRSELYTNDADLIAAMVDTLRGVECVHSWMVTLQRQTYMDSRCSKCGDTKRETWD